MHQKTIARSGHTLVAASSAMQASHILIDPDDGAELNAFLRARAGQPVQGREHEDVKQHVVTLDWAKSSFLAGIGLPEEDFGFSDDESDEGHVDAEADGGSGTSQVEGLDSLGRRNGNIWTPAEEENVARWLASNPQKKSKEDGGSIWDQYAQIMVST